LNSLLLREELVVDVQGALQVRVDVEQELDSQ